MRRRSNAGSAAPEASSSQTEVHTGGAEPVPGHSPWVMVAEGWAALYFEQASLVTLVLGALRSHFQRVGTGERISKSGT